MALGVITEQGDLGLGFNPLTEQEEATVKNNYSDTASKRNDDDSKAEQG
jgi:hypothetical protein